MAERRFSLATTAVADALAVLNQDFYNALQLSEFVLQMMIMYLSSEDATNNQILKEMDKQNEKYLAKIVKQNNKILDILSVK